MASQFPTRSHSSAYEIQLRRNRLRRTLLETLERRELLAADLLGVVDYTTTATITAQQYAQQQAQLGTGLLAFNSLGDNSTAAYDVANFLDSQLGSSEGDVTTRPWFPLVQRSYANWSQSLGLQSATTVSAGLVGEGEGGLIAEGEAGGPRLLSVSPNSGQIFTFNNTNQLTEAPTELVFRFDGSSDLDPASLSGGIRVTRAGGDGLFGNLNDSVIEPGYLGFGDNNRIVVLRFASPLQDDLYRVELIGQDDPAKGLTAIKNAAGLKLQTRAIDATPDDLTRDSVDFNLELGAQILAVVPQPVDRVGGVLTPRSEVIRVYFNDDDLYSVAITTGSIAPDPTVVSPAFYQLIHTAETVQPNDDQVFAPISIHYDPASDMAELTFARPIDKLAGPGTYRLRIGSRDAVISTTNPETVFTLNPVDPAGIIQNATPLGTWNSAFSAVVNQSIITTDANVLPLDFPGSNFDPGHRDIQDETHLLGGADTSPGIAQRAFNFAFDRSYGPDAAGRPVNTSITPDQVARVREIFEIYSSVMGVDFVETRQSGLTIVVGDMFPLGQQSGPGGVAGVAGGSLAIMDGAEPWNNSYGGDFFTTAMHEIGHLLNLGHTYDLPPLTIMGDEGALTNPNPGLPTEFAFPGDADILHGQHMYRPDNRDVDMYSFSVPAGQAGQLTAETIAERLPNSSNLDTVLLLWKQQPGGGVELISTSNDSRSADSFLTSTLTEGTYFISVTGKGNEDFDPLVPNTGSGAVSQGNYQLKLDFRPTVDAGGLKFSIEDSSGTPLDGDGDGIAGGNFDFWFRAAAPLDPAVTGQAKTIFVDKSFTGSQSGADLGSPARPLNTLDMSKWPAGLLQPGDIVRVVGSSGASTDRPAYEIGRGGVGNQVLSDGLALEVPRGVTMMIDAGAIFKLQGSRVSTGSLNASIDQSMSALQVLGTPLQTVNFTSYRDETQGLDTNPLTTKPGAGDWGGLDFHEDIDRREGYGSYERNGIFLNYVSHADIRYGGGQVTVSAPSPTVSPINMSESRPTLLNNTIRFSADAAMSADPNSFEETRFSDPRYQFAGNFRPDYARVGPDIRGNILLDNSINGLFVKTSTAAGGPLTTLDVAARWDDKDITYVLGENLIIRGTPGGALQESIAPNMSLVQQTPTSGGSLAGGATVQYKLTNLDLNGAEGVTSSATLAVTLTAGQSAVLLAGLPKVTGDFVSRRLWRSINSGPFQLVAQLDGDSTTYKDIGLTLAGTLPASTPALVNRARPNARLQIDPGVVVKSAGSRIEVGMGATLIAEGTADRPIVFTSRFDDRYGAGGTFDTNNDGAGSNPGAGDWGGLVTRPLASMSIDHALITFGGGVTSVAGGFSGFNAVEVQQADVRLANSRLEVNASGLGGNVGGSRTGHGPNDASIVFVVGSQPVLINNVFLDNSVNNTAVISINANAMKTTNVTDPGRQTGTANRSRVGISNMGPLVAGNQLLGNGLNGMRIRGQTLTTETVWDDTDIVHILQSEVIVPDFHSEGGLRLQSRSDESLVVKLSSAAGLTAMGRPLDITDRIGGTLQIIGAPGFPVVMTSIKDDTVGAGFDPHGRALVDTNNNGPSVGAPGDWRSVRFEPYANDRNVDAVIELETDQLQDTGTNDVVGTAQNLGALAASLGGGDENLRLGFVVDGSIASPQDLDVYSFSAVAGTQVWLDIDRTSGSLDSVVELLDANGRILAQSNNSLAESMGTQGRYVATTGPSPLPADSVAGLEKSPFAPANSHLSGVARDLYSVNPLDAGMRILLPGSTGSTNNYYVRVRSSNLAPGDANAKLQNPADERKGLTTGNYRLQVRLQQTDEVPGSTVRYADIRYATNGIEARGMAASSPLLGQLAESGATTALGNIAASDRSSVTASGMFDDDAVDVYSFSVSRGSVQVIDPAAQNTHIGMVFDIDYADGFGRPDTTLWVFDSANRLVLVGTDSNIADDQPAPGRGANLDDLSRGSGGARDPFIGASELPAGNYTVVVTNNSQTAVALNQFQQADAANPLLRLEPINSVQRISQDRFESGALGETGGAPVQVSFSNNVNNNLVQWTLADLTAYVVQRSGLVMLANPYTGAPEAHVSDASNTIGIEDVAMSPDGRLVAPARVSGNVIDGNSGDLLALNSTGALDSDQVPVGSTVAGNSGLRTYTTQVTSGPGVTPLTYAVQQRDHANTTGNVPEGDGFQFNGLTFATADDNQLKLFGVGSRDRNAWSFNLPTVDANGAVTGILTDAGSGNPVKIFNTTNVVYKLNPTTGAVINPGTTPADDRAGTSQVGNHAGTQKVEFGRFLSGTVGDPNGPYTAGTVTGLAQIGNTLYAVSNRGEFYRVNIGNGDSSFAANEIVNTGENRYQGTKSFAVVEDGGAPIQFTGLTRGPRNLEGGRYANMLFATTANGTLYAINTSGVLQPIFPGYSYKVHSADRGGLGNNVVGIDFSPLDVNLFHLTDLRDDEPGHGRPEPFDKSQNGAQLGDRALYFGFQDSTGNQQQQGDWSGLYDVASYNRTYNLPGGAHGATVSNPIDLRGYSADDLPMLYFNYFLDTENANSDLDQTGRMRDAFRVYGAGEDGQWILLTTNNTPRDQGLNRNNHSGNSNVDELDNSVNGNYDAFGNPLLTQEAFDQRGWRQVRTSLGAFAGQENVRLRFEFSTAASFQTGDPLRGGVELIAVTGSKLQSGTGFTVTPLDGAAGASRQFVFDMGLVLSLPAGADLTSGVSTLTINGTPVVFSTTDNSGANVQYAATDAPATIAQKLANRLPAIFPGVVFANRIVSDPNRPSVLSIAGLPEGTSVQYSLSPDMNPAVLSAFPQASAAVKIPVDKRMTEAQVRDAIRTALATTFNDVNNMALNPAGALNVWKYTGNTLQLFKYDVSNNTSALGLTTERVGDFFGANPTTRTGAPVSLAHMDERTQNNTGEGLYIDDIIIGFAERGEMVVSAAADSTFAANRQYAKTLYNVDQPERGRYQLTVRTAAEYGESDKETGRLALQRQFNTNDRLSQTLGIQVNTQAAGSIPDGATFTLTDGRPPVTFEFDVFSGTGGPSIPAVTPGHVPISISSQATRQEIALAIRDAINSPAVKNLLNVSASLQGEMRGAFFAPPAGGTTVLLHGQVATSADGSFDFANNTFLNPVRWGQETGFGEDLGDSERPRPQGQLLLVGNTITNSQQYGINVTEGNRNQSGLSGSVGNRPYPGAPIAFPTANPSGLAPGVVIVSNIVASNLAGGIRLQGDAGGDAPTQIARVLNNTIYGVAAGDNGILIENGATPTILNNIIAGTATGVRASAGSSAVLGANVYQSNTTNTVNVGVGSFAEILTPSAPLFVDVTNRRFYLAPGSRAIDSSLEALQERPALAQVKNALGLAESPMLAPDLDVTGQRRVDDPDVNSPVGLGGNVFKDRGAVDRSDFSELEAVILQPQDNDAALVDSDRNPTTIQLTRGTLDFFSILLQDFNGTGPDPATVVQSAIGLTENGRLLRVGVDYVVGYNANSRTVRLTPLAGIWRTDSVYEITLNNLNRFELSTSAGSALNDGDRFSLTSSSGIHVFEFDNNGSSSTTGTTLVPFDSSMSAYEVATRLRAAINTAGLGKVASMKGDGTISVAGISAASATGSGLSVAAIRAITDLAGNPLRPNRTNGQAQFTIIMPDALLDFGDALGAGFPVLKQPSAAGLNNGNGARHVLLPVDVPQLVLGSVVDAEADGQPTTAANGDDTDRATAVLLETLGSVGGLTSGIAGPAVLSFPVGSAVSGQKFTITDFASHPFAPVTFEFETNTNPSNVVIPTLAGDTPDQVAAKVATVVQAAQLSGRLSGLTPVAASARVSLGDSHAYSVDLTAAPAVNRVASGNVQLVIPNSIATLADGQTLTVQDGAGHSLQFELNNTDPAALPATPVANGRIAVDVNLATATASDVATALASAINGQIAARKLALGNSTVGTAVGAGMTVSVIGDDDDGVHFGGVFNPLSKPVPITVISSGAGLLDAWIDWNGDGDFNDASEILFPTSQPVRQGANVFMIQTPVNAVAGFSVARFRLSTLGGLTPSGVGIGGEVEDYLVEIVAGAPPVAVSDSYTTDEDVPGGLVVPRLPTVAGGPHSILANDTDADIVVPAVLDPGVNLFVNDENPGTLDIDPVRTTTHGTLTLLRDGSFTYLPDADFNGTDTFVYNATDGRLMSRVPTTVTIMVNPVNDPPLAVDDVRTVMEDQAMIFSGADLTANDKAHHLGSPTEAGQTLTLLSATVITHTVSDLGGVPGLAVRIASQPGQGSNGIRVYTSVADLGAGVKPTVATSLDRIDVVLNSNSTSPSTADDFITAINGDAAASALVQVTLDAGSGSAVIGTAATSYSPLQVPPRGSRAPIVSNNSLSFSPAPHYNSSIGGPVLIAVTIQDDETAGPPARLTSTSTLTLNIMPVNDSPLFEMPPTISISREVPQPAGPTTTVDPFITKIEPGAHSPSDELGQQVTFVATALDPSLFYPGDATANPPIPDGLPRIDANGVLTYRLAVNVNQMVPFPTILVQVVASDDGAIGNGQVLTNRFNPALAFPATPNLYDGSTLTVTDQNGNLAIFELDDAGLPGVGATGGLPHIAIPFSSADTHGSLNQKIIAAINAPPPASVRPGTGPWTSQAFVDVLTKEIHFTQTSTVVSAAPAGVSAADALFAVRPTNQSAPRTFTILAEPVNDPPEFTINDSLLASSYPEDSAAVTIDDFIVDARPGPVTALDELLSQTVRVHSVTSTPGAFEQFSVIVNPATGKGSLTFKTNVDVNSATHDLTVVVTLKDGDENVDTDVQFTSKTFTITVDPVNDRPEFSVPVKQLTYNEDVGAVSAPGFATNILAGPATAVDETTIPATKQTVHFELVSNSNAGLFEVQPSFSPTGELTFRTKQDQNGSAIVVMRLKDAGTVPARTPSDAAQSIVDETFTITIAPVNDAPTFRIAGTASSLEDAGRVVIPGFLADILPGTATATDESTQTLTIHATPIDPTAFAHFSLSVDGTLSYETRTDANRLNADFRVEVYFTDDGASAPAPNNNRSVTQTFTVDVTPVNDPPSFALPQTRVDVNEDAQNSGLPRGTTIVPGFATNIKRGPDTATDEVSQVLNPFQIVNLVGGEKFSVLPTIDTATGNLSFTTAPNANGLATFVVSLTDQGASSPAPNNNASGLQTFTIAIAAINDAPEFTIPMDITVDEDAGLISRIAFATDIRRGAASSHDENSQLLTFVVTALNPALFSTQPAITVDGRLTFQTAQDVNSANAELLVEVTLFDDGPNAPPPNVNHSDTRTFTITVNPVNDAPITVPFNTNTDEDSPSVIQAADVIADDLAGPTPDEVLGQTLRMTQIQRTSLNGGTIEPVFDLVDPTRILSFRYSPPLNFNGQDTFLYVTTDDGAPQRSGTGTITMTVNPINDPPAFNRGADQMVNEDAAPVSVANWATGIVAGPPSAVDELANQTVSFTVVAAQPEWFAVQPAVSSQGTLTYTLAKDVNGSTTVVVTAVDNGPSTGAHINHSAPQTFTIDIAPINDPPVFTAGPTVTVEEDGGAYSEPWATNIAPAQGLLATPPTATDEASQSLHFEVTVNQPQLFSVQPRISQSGVLEFTTAPFAFGTALVVVGLVDNGPASALDNPRSAPQTLTISISPENDPPVANDDNYATDENSVLNVPAPGILANDTDIDLPDDFLEVGVSSFVTDLGAHVTLNADGSLTYDPTGVLVFKQLTAGQTVSDTFVYQIKDAAGELSNEATVNITIHGVNDAPVAVDDQYTVGIGQPRELDILANDTDVDSTIDLQTIKITSRPGFGTTTVSPTGIVTYTPEPGFRGNDSFRYTVKDSTGLVSNEAQVLLIVNSAPVAANDSAFTYKGAPVIIDVLSNDFDSDGFIDTSSVRIEVSAAPKGAVEVLANGTLRFTPAEDFAGEASFAYSVQDNSGTRSNVATVSIRVQNSRWQNPQNSLDVNNDGFISPIDALLIINYLNARRNPFLPSSGLVPPPYIDTNGDELATSNDVMQVINYLNQNARGKSRGEGEAFGTEYVMSVTPQQMVASVGPTIARELMAVRNELLEEALATSAAPINATTHKAPVIAGSASDRRDEELLDLLSRAAHSNESDSAQSSPQADSIDSALDELLNPNM